MTNFGASANAAELAQEESMKYSEATPSTTPPETDDEEEAAPQQLQAGLYDDGREGGNGYSNDTGPSSEVGEGMCRSPPRETPSAPCEAPSSDEFDPEETFFIFDWDDTVLPSTWVQRQGLRLDAGSFPTAEQKQILAEAAVVAARTFRAARQHGTVILVTNAERGWIELSCQKFLPTLAPMLESMKLVSARTTYESKATCRSPLEWKLRAFEAEIALFYGPEVVSDPSKRKNVLSLGDSLHEREAMQRATAAAPNCCSKSLKFVERPDVSQICKQHQLIADSFERIVHHQGDLDVCIRCP